MKTLAQMASAVLRDTQIPEDTSTAGVQALADAKQFLNESWLDLWGRRNWPESFILGSYTVPASTNIVPLGSITPDTGFNVAGNGFAATFVSAVATRAGTNAIFAEDPGVLERIKADYWSSTDTPSNLINRGKNGIFLLGKYTAGTLLNFYGKANCQDLTDGETPCLDCEQALIARAVAKMTKTHERDNNRAVLDFEEYEAELMKIVQKIEEQAGNIKRLVPKNPWTNYFSRRRDYTAIGIGINNTFR